jgi:hypothetical protein
MAKQSRKLAIFSTLAAIMLPVTAAHAQYYGATTQPPLYPYAAQSDQSYAVEVAPNTYMIQRSAPTRAYPYVRSHNGGRGILNQVVAPNAGRFDRPHKPVDHALVDELRQRHQTKGPVVNTTRIVRDPPIVRETRRVVDDPPRIIERRQIVDDDAGTVEIEKPAGRDDTKKRVIQADAEVTILGPDRMSIRLFRKGQGPKANAKAE